MLADQHHRLLATDPNDSYIVQAPAGSGKTELLTQRFLRLLTRVSQPEHVIALTFTRKAAHEMRDRIMRALQAAAEGTQPTSDHQRTTLAYAQQVLAHDQQQNWQLLLQPNRLRIMTIDALCQWLSQAIPLHALHYAGIHEQPAQLYNQAARDCLHYLRQTQAHHSDLACLLSHLDNRQDRLLTLFAQLLGQRDQWLGMIYQGKTQTRAQFEQALAWIETHEIEQFCKRIPLDLQQELLSLIQTLLAQATLVGPHWQAFRSWTLFSKLNSELATHLATVLLTSSQQMRKSFDHHVGFRRESCPIDAYTTLKLQSQQLLAKLAALPDFRMSLIHISALPKPQYDDQQWDVLQALFNLLPVLVAHLELLFQANNHIDFIGIAHQAEQALGSEQAPTDLTLYLDHHIQHLLVDEFQDTSIQQFSLLTQLIRGFVPGDGRTLFVVGDPMQSIYRFRAAEVGLFLRAQQQGIGPVSLKPLYLQANFRACAPLVDWVNQQFQEIFPLIDDIESGAISFHASVATKPTQDGFIQAIYADNPDIEAQTIVDCIRQELHSHPEQNVAVLVRSRHQLPRLIRCLHQHNIPFQGVDIDLLAHLPHIRDVWALTQALLMPANRLAWLTFLRSPWCGLKLAELLIIAQCTSSIYSGLSRAHTLDALSDDAKIRAKYIFSVCQHAIKTRRQQPLVDWIRTVLTHLHQESILTPAQQTDLEQYWLLLTQFEHDGQIDDIRSFEQQLQSLYSKRVTSARLHIMTIHKAKGLEFDCVILPSLGSKKTLPDPVLMRWLTLPTENEIDSLLLVSPIKAASQDFSLLYDYLGRIDLQKNYYEMQRLLYVALTRAKHRLYLFDHSEKIRSGSFRQMLHKVVFQPSPFNPCVDEKISEKLCETSLPELWHLPVTYYEHPPLFSDSFSSHVPVNTAAEPRLQGIVIHEMLQWICTYHPPSSDHIPWALAKKRLNALGISAFDTFDRIRDLIEAFLADPIGQWICHPHLHEQNEHALLVENGTSTRIIDRTFVDNGVRWIIDFKTGQWTQKSHEQYQIQLQHYAELMQNISRQTIQCGIYYLADRQWIAWEPTLCTI